jgi:DNA invertase Pin-like site-specific DNA recombinase
MKQVDPVLSEVFPYVFNNIPENIKYAAIYCRKSSANTGNELSFSVQKNICETFCKERNLEITCCVIETISGKNMNQMVELNKLLQQIQKDTVIVVCDVTRFSRNVLQGLQAIDTLLKKDSTIYAVCNCCCYNDKYIDRHQFRSLLNQAELEHDQITDRINRSVKHRRRIGHKIGKAKYGYEIYYDNKGIRREKKHKLEQKTVSIIRRFLNSGKKMSDIIDYLNNTDNDFRGKEWTASRVKYVSKSCQ